MIGIVTSSLAVLLGLITAIFDTKRHQRLTVWGWAVILLSAAIVGGNVLAELDRQQERSKIRGEDVVVWLMYVAHGHPGEHAVPTSARVRGRLGEAELYVELERHLEPERIHAGRGGGGRDRFRYLSKKVFFASGSAKLDDLTNPGLVLNCPFSSGGGFARCYFDVFIRGRHFHGDIMPGDSGTLVEAAA